MASPKGAKGTRRTVMKEKENDDKKDGTTVDTTKCSSQSSGMLQEEKEYDPREADSIKIRKGELGKKRSKSKKSKKSKVKKVTNSGDSPPMTEVLNMPLGKAKEYPKDQRNNLKVKKDKSAAVKRVKFAENFVLNTQPAREKETQVEDECDEEKQTRNRGNRSSKA